MLVLNLPTFENKKYAAYDRFHGNGPHGEIPHKKKPIRMLGFPSRLLCRIIILDNYSHNPVECPSHFSLVICSICIR